MTRTATLTECYRTLRLCGMGIVGAAFLGFVLFMRGTKIEITIEE